jgi:hypothetical protein
MRYRHRTLPVLLQQDWVGFLFLLPFLVLLAIHDALGLSDSIVGGNQNDRDSFAFNWCLIIVFLSGVSTFVAHAVFVVLRRPDWRWFVAKLLVLIAYWASAVSFR